MCADTTPEFDATRPGWPIRWATGNFGERAVKSLLTNIHIGTLTVELPSGFRLTHRGELPGPEAILILSRWRALRRLFLHGDIGFAEAYLDGDCDSPDLAALIEVVALNQDRIDGRLQGGMFHRMLNRLIHRMRANSEIGSRRNIIAHYDLGNDFYRLWLDDGMSYSSGLYRDDADTLEVAQKAKQDRALELLRLTGSEKTLEIGIGWGGILERLADDRSARVAGITLSPSQLAYAGQRLQRQGLTADMRCQDYRRVTGTFDRVVSIEMLEAVGREYWPVFFNKLHDLLRPGGVAVLQVITIAEARFETYFKHPDFIQRSVFPGGMLPSRGHLHREIEAAKLKLTHEETFGMSYARTLADWRQRFEAAWPSIAALGYAPRFKRLWRYYLAYCEGGFRADNIDVGLYRIERAL